MRTCLSSSICSRAIVHNASSARNFSASNSLCSSGTNSGKGFRIFWPDGCQPSEPLPPLPQTLFPSGNGFDERRVGWPALIFQVCRPFGVWASVWPPRKNSPARYVSHQLLLE
jgi:hypothetical protein